MSEEEAILQMELLDHEFYMYIDSDNNKSAVVYKRKNGDMELLHQNDKNSKKPFKLGFFFGKIIS